MSLKNLSHFTEFNASLFLAQKELRFISATRWIERSETGSEIEKGVKVGVLIFSDESDYPNEKIILVRATHCKSSTCNDEGL